MKLTTAILFGFLASQAQAQTFSVCEVLTKLSELNGKKIAVRGVWIRGDAGQGLRAIPPCEIPTVRQGWRFFDEIDVIPDTSAQSMAGYYAAYNDIRKYRKGYFKIFATLHGRLETREHFAVSPDGPWKQTPDVFRRFFIARLRFWSADHLKVVPYEPGEVEAELKERSGDPYPIRVQ
jgi:hypothetical protein